MSEQVAGGAPGAARGSWKVAAWSAFAMVVLALVGVALATAHSPWARNYWVALVPVYGALCTAAAWKDARAGERLVLRQALHWLAIAGVVALDFAIRGFAGESGAAAGLNPLMLLALGCLLAGVHLDWLFVPVGLLLALTLVLVARAEQYLWLILLAAALALAAVGWLWWRRRSQPAPAPPV